MRPDVVDLLRTVDPERSAAGAPDPDWDAMAQQILAAAPRPPARRSRRRGLIAPAVAAVALAGVLAVALTPDGVRPSPVERAYAAATRSAIYHYVAVVVELEGPQRRPLRDTRARSEGWIDPGTRQIHEVGDGMEWSSDGRRRQVYIPFLNLLETHEEPPRPEGSDPAGSDVFSALTRSVRVGTLRDEGTASYDGRRVHRLVAVNAQRTFRQTFLVDAETSLPVLFRTETGDHVRDGGEPAAGQRVIEQRFERFERLPDGADRSVLQLRPHPGARRTAGPAPARPPE